MIVQLPINVHWTLYKLAIVGSHECKLSKRLATPFDILSKPNATWRSRKLAIVASKKDTIWDHQQHFTHTHSSRSSRIYKHILTLVNQKRNRGISRWKCRHEWIDLVRCKILCARFHKNSFTRTTRRNRGSKQAKLH